MNITPIRPLSWHSNPLLKAEAVDRMKTHQKADRFGGGTYVRLPEYGLGVADAWKGCFHGCLTAEALAEREGMSVPAFVRANPVMWHYEGQRLWGIHQAMGSVLDNAFEMSPSGKKAGIWAVAVTETIPVGVDLYPLALELHRLPRNAHFPTIVLNELAKVG